MSTCKKKVDESSWNDDRVMWYLCCMVNKKDEKICGEHAQDIMQQRWKYAW